MPRSSRHKSHRPHKHSSRDARERSESDEERNSRDRKPKEEPAGTGSGTMVSPDQELDKPKPLSSSQPSQGKDVLAPGNGDFSGDHGKKRKDRPADMAATADRWNGGGEVDQAGDKELKREGYEPLDSEKTAKAKVLAVDTKSRSRKREGSRDRKEDSGGKDEFLKRRSEKDSIQRESTSQHKDAKERDRERMQERDKEHGSERARDRGLENDRERGSERERERGSERDNKVQDVRRERSDDVAYRKQGTRARGTEGESLAKRDLENTDWQIQDELRNPELEKELDKRIRRRRDGSADKDKWQGDGRDGDDRCLSSRDDHAKNGCLKADKHKDGRYRNKDREDLEREQKHRDDKHRDDQFSRDHTIDRSDNKLCRDENMALENHHKKSKLQDSDLDGSPYIDDQGTKYKDNRGRKRSSDENEDRSDPKPRNAKEPCASMEKNDLGNSKLNSNIDRGRPVHIHSDKADSTPSSNRSKSSPSSSSHVVKDQYRHSSKQAESSRRNSLSEERLRPSTALSELASDSGAHGRVSEPRPMEKPKEKDLHSDVLLVENAAASQYERTPRSDDHTSSLQLTEKSPSLTNDRQYLNKTDDRCGFDVEEMGQRSSCSRDRRDFSTDEDREQKFLLEKPAVEDHSQAELLNSDSVSVGSSSKRIAHFSSGSPGHLPPPPPVRLGIDSPSILGSLEEDNRGQGGDRKSSSRYRRNGDMNMGRGQGNAWKGVPNWPSPIANGFIPFQHGPPPGGFHPVVQQYPAQSLFGVRPSMDLNHTGDPYHMHENPDRFSSHSRPFGWRNPVDDSCPPHLQGWDGSNGVFGDESHIYGRPDWEHNRHLMGGHGWEINADMWKGQNGSLTMEFPVTQKEPDYSTCVPTDEARLGQSGYRLRNERSRSERLQDESIEIKRSSETPAMNAAEAPPKVIQEKRPEPSKTSIDDDARFCCTYLSKLDISHDLAHTELYKQCMSLIGTEEMTGNCDITEHIYPQNIRMVNKVTSKSFNHDSSSIFPAITDVIFKRAMSLYKKQNEEMKANIPTLFLHSKEDKDSPKTSDVEKVEPVENLVSSEEIVLVNVRSPRNMREESNISTDAKDNLPSNVKEQLSDTITNVVFAEGSFRACEVLMPECRLNLNRIHNSPESTH